MRPSPRALAVALASLAACSDNQLPPQITPVDGLPDDLAPELLREVAALDPRLDTDGDGLMDLDELVGWTLRVDETGRPQGIITRIVTSDPDMADTDGDGVLDGVERMVGSDPRLADTDGDGLDDYQEVYRWGTSPASVDSDGDSRGKEPNPSGAPDITLFDAAELQLTADPANPSGPNAQQIAGPLATSPLLADTDGDGVWDWDENSTRTRSSTLADVPRLVIGVKPASRAGFYLNLTIYEETTRTEERGKDLAFGAGLATSIGNTTTHEISTWLSGSVALGGVLNIGISTEQVGADVGLNVEEEVGMGIKNTLTTEFRADSTVSTSFSQVLSEVSSDGQTRTQTIDGGRIKLLIDVTNISTVPCKVRNLSLQLARFDPVIAKTRPVAQLRPTTNADKDLILGANKSVTVEVEAQDVQADRMIALMKNPGLMILAPANYDVLTAGDDDYDFIEADIADRTARVTLDFGPDDVEVYDVAANVGRDASGRPTGVSLAEVLDRLDIPYKADPLDNPDFERFQQFIFKIGTRSTELYTGAPPPLGDPAPYPADLAPGPRPLRRGWYAIIERKNGTLTFDDQLFVARLLPGDRATLTFIEDKDRDGVSQLEERLHGTSDDAIDSDGDGLSDWWEIKVGHVVRVDGQPPRAVKSNPAVKDSDNDGLDDKAELLAGTHPWIADTDGDRISDKAEVDAQTNPLHYDSAAPVVPHCGVAPTGPVYVQSRRFEVTDPDVDLTSVTVRWVDGHTITLRTPPTGTWFADLVHPGEILSVTATDLRDLTTTRQCVQAVP